ncbi:MAG: transcription initiation factor IIB family protein [Candidatus Hodarchaeota archaeon]
MSKGAISKSEDRIQNSPARCPECSGMEFVRDYSRGETICGACGLVINDHIVDSGPEWRAFTAEEKNLRSRVGAPMTLRMADKGLSTMIGKQDTDSFGKKLTARRRRLMHRLRKWNFRSIVHSSKRRNLAHALSEMQRLSSQIGLSKDIMEAAALLYRKVIERGLTRGRSIDAMIAASLYLACRLHGLPRPLDEIERYSRFDRKELGYCVRTILSKLNIKIPRASAIDFIPRFGNELGLSTKTQRKAIEILDAAKMKGLTSGKDPTGLAAAALYIASMLEGERRTQSEVSKVVAVTEVTVRNRYRELIRELNINLGK